MPIIRTYKTALLLAVNLASVFAGGAANLIFIFGGRSRSRVQAALTMLWCRAACRILGVHVSASGQKRKRGGFTVCNHAGYIDVFVIGSRRPTCFLAMHEIKGWPLLGWLARLGGTVFVNRNSKRAALHAMKEIERKLDCGITVIIFPEGTTSNGRTVRAFKSTFFKIPVVRNMAVRPASIRYAQDAVDSVAWHGGAHILPHFWHLAGLKRIDAALHYGHSIQPLSEWGTAVEKRKKLCMLAHESVLAGFEGKKHIDREDKWKKR